MDFFNFALVLKLANDVSYQQRKHVFVLEHSMKREVNMIYDKKNPANISSN